MGSHEHTIEPHADLRAYFRERLVEAMQQHAVSTGDATEFYLVNLLAGHAHVPSTSLLCPLVERLAEALGTPETSERFRRFRQMGDSALYVSGFFADHLERRGISRDYVATMGGRAYRAAYDLSPYAPPAEAGFHDVYGELASRFGAFAQVLDDVREATALRTPQDIVKLYDRWRRTHSPRLAARLRAEGVFPQVERHHGRILH